LAIQPWVALWHRRDFCGQRRDYNLA
jgi:hypothetical protein